MKLKKGKSSTIIHKETLVSDEVISEEFVCNLTACKGICCVDGMYGAPLEEEEMQLIEENLEVIKEYMDPEALELLEKEGFYETDPDGDIVTTCRNGRECVFVSKDKDGIYKCTIEQAFRDGKSTFHKPISCHLYPVRLSQVGKFTALNYDRWYICNDACVLGKKLNIPVYKFVKEALIRKFGAAWYEELEDIVK